MFRFRSLAVVAALTAVSVASFAQDDQHKAHHPAGAASAAMPAPATGKPAGMPDMAMMDQHMKAMQAMHDKMASAKTCLLYTSWRRPCARAGCNGCPSPSAG